MGKEESKIEKKKVKASLKAQKADTKLKILEQEKGSSAQNSSNTALKIQNLQQGTGIFIENVGDNSRLIVEGLNKDQLQRLLPEVNKEVFITLTETRNPVKAMFLKFIREGAWETLIKVIAGLIVG
ncbi:MAG: hypothetical protein JW737_00570, partial [Acidobacteria bacterium]|nr:hypothetical protein [Acidobacteriota bacterium]